VHFVTATAIDWIGQWPALVEVHLAEADGSDAVILGKTPVIDVGGLRRAGLPTRLNLRCDVVGQDDNHTVLIRLGHGATDQHGRDTFRVDADAVRPETPAEAFDRLLLNYHIDPDGITDVEPAWLAFTEFAQTGIDGLAPGDDADGFIVQWGRYSWNERTAALTFTRRLNLLTDGSGPAAGHPALRQVDLEMRFRGFHTLATGDSGLHFAAIGPPRAAALAAVRAAVEEQPLLSALWHTKPVTSSLTYGPAD
jgi:hypothetical protein